MTEQDSKTNQDDINQESQSQSDTLEANEEDVLEVVTKSEEEQLREDLADAKDRFLRLAAEFENFKKITLREQQNSLKFANENLVLALLPSLDALMSAIDAAQKTNAEKNDIAVGVEMVLKQLLDTLNKFGVETFSAVGQKFDPSRHEALLEQEDNSVEPGYVITEYQKGFMLHNRLLRPARVIIAKAASEK